MYIVVCIQLCRHVECEVKFTHTLYISTHVRMPNLSLSSLSLLHVHGATYILRVSFFYLLEGNSQRSFDQANAVWTESLAVKPDLDQALASGWSHQEESQGCKHQHHLEHRFRIEAHQGTPTRTSARTDILLVSPASPFTERKGLAGETNILNYCAQV